MPHFCHLRECSKVEQVSRHADMYWIDLQRRHYSQTLTAEPHCRVANIYTELCDDLLRVQLTSLNTSTQDFSLLQPCNFQPLPLVFSEPFATLQYFFWLTNTYFSFYCINQARNFLQTHLCRARRQTGSEAKLHDSEMQGTYWSYFIHLVQHAELRNHISPSLDV